MYSNYCHLLGTPSSFASGPDAVEMSAHRHVSVSHPLSGLSGTMTSSLDFSSLRASAVGPTRLLPTSHLHPTALPLFPVLKYNHFLPCSSDSFRLFHLTVFAASESLPIQGSINISGSDFLDPQTRSRISASWKGQKLYMPWFHLQL